MKQLLQSLKDGKTRVAEVPCPKVGRGQLLIASSTTLVSSGTERMLADFGKANLLGKARRQPDKVRMVLDKIRTDGLVPTIEAVMNKLDQPLPLGYCNVGVVIECGEGATGFSTGDRVVSNGKHAEIVASPTNLCAKVPDGVDDDAAAFTVLAAIGLQGIRLANPTLGESVVVTGLGLVGLITVQLLRANGCRVLGLDFNPERLALARRFGADVVDLSGDQDPITVARSFSRGHGVDAVIVTAATRSSEPIHQAATMCRKRGRIVLVGVTGLELSRSDFYEKELSFQVSCSYGPGRHDPDYEDKGFDYPVGFVRWTEQRNFEAVLDLMASGRLDMLPLISHRVSVAEAESAYDLMIGEDANLGILLEYPDSTEAQSQSTIDLESRHPAEILRKSARGNSIAFIGSGNYATAALIPAFRAAGADLNTVVSRSGVSGLHAGRKFGFQKTTTDIDSVFGDRAVDAVVICTRHDSHAELVCRALAAGKDVFVEKPLALTDAELDTIEAQLAGADGDPSQSLLMVGFNRRFAPHTVKAKKLLAACQAPKAMVMTVNAGAISSDHWIQDPSVGGGRIIGEACHFIDLLRFLADSPIVDYSAWSARSATNDTTSLELAFADGSSGVIHYFSNGSRAFPKERLEIFCDGGVLQLNNFRRLIGFAWPGFRAMNLWRQDKGQRPCAKAFIEALAGDRNAPISIAELIETGRVSVALSEAVRA